MGTAKIYKKGQVTIPKAVRDQTGLELGDRVVVEARGDEVVVRRPRGILEFQAPQTDSEPLPWEQARKAARAGRILDALARERATHVLSFDRDVARLGTGERP